LRQPHHIQQVQQLLRQQGLLKLSLGFPDDEGRYLHGLIVGLAELHGHGLPVDHSASQGWFWDIRPSATQFQSNGSRARSETMEEFPWHTDCSYEASPPRYFALQVLQPDRRGGGVFSALGVDNILRHLSHSSRAALCCLNYRITVPPEFVRSNGKRHIVGSILAVADDNRGRPITTLRFREDIITPLTTEAAGAVKELKQVLMSAEAQRDTLHLTPGDMPRGSILLLNNRRWLHARNEVMDPERHLRRVRWDATSFP
jgi:alpha-ketoglutarate-dependent taurine dioxygenase